MIESVSILYHLECLCPETFVTIAFFDVFLDVPPQIYCLSKCNILCHDLKILLKIETQKRVFTRLSKSCLQCGVADICHFLHTLLPVIDLIQILPIIYQLKYIGINQLTRSTYLPVKVPFYLIYPIWA